MSKLRAPFVVMASGAYFTGAASQTDFHEKAHFVKADVAATVLGRAASTQYPAALPFALSSVGSSGPGA